MSILVSILVAVVGVVGSAIFSGVETGLYVVNRVRLAVLAGRGDRRASRLEAELERPERLLGTLLIANNAANYAGSLGVVAIINTLALPAWGVVVLNTIVVVPILFVLGETIPKDLFRTHADQWTLRFIGPLVLGRRLLTVIGVIPLLSLIDRAMQWLVGGRQGYAASPRGRVTRFIRESAASGSLSEAQLDLADRALSMRRLTVMSEMTPWRQVVFLKLKDVADDPRVIARRTMRSRLPVVSEEGRVVGLVGIQDLLLRKDGAPPPVESLMPRYSPETPVSTALETLRESRRPMGVVEDREGRPLGVVTLKDLVEPLLGDLRAW